MSQASRIPYWLFALTVVVLCVANIAAWYTFGGGELTIRAYTTWTARISFTLFTLAFTASALVRRWPNDVTRWCIANRRYLGLSFALAHAVHFGALSMVMIVTDVEPELVTIVFGGSAYVFVVLMALTSNDRSVQLLGANWSRLHSVGGYYIWIIFAYTFVGGIFQSAFSVLMLIVAILSLALKIEQKRAMKAELSA
jgi:sulfoxide reductase heme-binding subunit YedZ